MTTKRIMASARLRDCTIRIPGVCNFNPETTVFAHLSGVRFGHGIGIKTRFGAYACSSCHDVVDGRVKVAGDKKDAYIAHLEGVIETIGVLLDIGLMVMK